jgi:hypothetical protein
MPVDLVELAEGRGVAKIGRDTVVGSDLRAALRLLLRDEKLAKYLFGLADFALADRVEFTTPDLRSFALLDSEIAKITRTGWLVAVVAPHDAIYGMARMWQAFADENGWETVVCRTRVEAEQWVIQRVSAKFAIELPSFVHEMGAVVS